MVNKHKKALLAWADLVDNYITGILLNIIKKDFRFASEKSELDFYLSTYEEELSQVPSENIFWYLQKQLVYLIKKKIFAITLGLKIFDLEFKEENLLIITTALREGSLIKAVKPKRPIDVDKIVIELNDLLKPLYLKVIPGDIYHSKKEGRFFSVVIDTPDANRLRNSSKIKILDWQAIAPI